MTFKTVSSEPTLQPLLPRNRRSAEHFSSQVTSLKLWYLLYFGAQYTQLFIPLILQSLMSFSPATIGTLMSVRRIVVSLVAPLFSILCDVTGAHRVLIITTLICYYCSTALLSSLRALVPVALTLFLRDAFLAGVEPSVNAATLAKLYQINQRADRPITFGDIRSFGSVGWGLMSFAVPVVCSYLFPHHPYAPILYSQVIMGIVVVAVTAFGVDLSHRLFSRYAVFSAADRAEETDEEIIAQSKLSSSPTAVVFGRRIASCLAATFLQGVVIGALQTTLFLYMAQMGLSKSIMGLSTLVAAVFECTFFLIGGRWKCASADNDSDPGNRDITGMRIAMSLNALMLILYVSLSSMPWHAAMLGVLFLSVCLSGTCSALFLSSAISVASISAPPEWRTGAQGVVQSVLFGVGPAVGAFISGICMQKFGIHVLYGGLAAADVAMVTLLR